MSLSHSLPYPFTTPCFKPFSALSLAHVPLSNPFRISSPDPLTVPCPLFPAYTTTHALLDLFTHSSASVSISAYPCLPDPVPCPFSRPLYIGRFILFFCPYISRVSNPFLSLFLSIGCRSTSCFLPIALLLSLSPFNLPRVHFSLLILYYC